MNIRLIKNQVSNLTIRKRKAKSKDKKTFDLRYSVNYDEDRIDNFEITFFAKVIVPNEIVIDITYHSVFETTEPINESFRKSDFPVVNAPAIAFPFFRAYISFLSLNSGFEAVMLPAINFTKFKNTSQVSQEPQTKS